MDEPPPTDTTPPSTSWSFDDVEDDHIPLVFSPTREDSPSFHPYLEDDNSDEMIMQFLRSMNADDAHNNLAATTTTSSTMAVEATPLPTATESYETGVTATTYTVESPPPFIPADHVMEPVGSPTPFPPPKVQASPVPTVMETYETEVTATPPPPPPPPVQVMNDEIDDSATAATNSPIMVKPLQTVRPLTSPEEVMNVDNIATPSSLVVDDAPQLAMVPYSGAFINNNNNATDHAGPSTAPIKRGRGRPKGSKNKNPTTKSPKPDPDNKKLKSCPGFISGITEEEIQNGNSDIVTSVLMRFEAARRRLEQLNIGGAITTTWNNCRNLGVRTNATKRTGHIPGIDVGHVFFYWYEMNMVGIHLHSMAGIEYMTVKDGDDADVTIVTSVVATEKGGNKSQGPDTLIYTGHGGDENRDQQAVGGNLAMQGSKRIGNDIRVIRREEDHRKEYIYFYDGLYTVTDYCLVNRVEDDPNSSLVYKFTLVRKPGQPTGYAAWEESEVLRLQPSSRVGVVIEDISTDKEHVPIPVVNALGVDAPEQFEYIRSLLHSSTILEPRRITDPSSAGCRDCRGRSCSTAICICIRKNRGEVPYTMKTRLLVCRKSAVYECGLSCKCSLDCPNRVVQMGVTIRMEVFKTTNRGWGLRTWEPIRAGSFICEFAGLRKSREEIEAEEEEDDYVFDSARSYMPFRWNYEPQLVNEDPANEVPERFDLANQILISAKRRGNVGRFMNHGCSPNVFWQPVEYEVNGERYFRVGFFAMRHIPPMVELTYDYGVSGEVVEEDDGEGGTRFVQRGNKTCLCGSPNCRGSFG